jgi:hypothetical protein
VEICVMENEQQVRTLILRVLNVAETGHPDGKSHAVYIYADGKNGRKQTGNARGRIHWRRRKSREGA